MSARRITDLGKDELRRAIALTIARSILLFSAVIYLYYVFPFGGGSLNAAAWIRLSFGLAFFALTTFLVARKVWNSKHPQLGAVEALAVAFPRFICVYAGVYLGLSHQNPAAFNEVLTHTSSLYFTVVTFGTVGFGDIRPVTDVARLVVTSQILVDVLFIALVVRGIFGLSRLALSRTPK